jgi:hypothetical protein
LSIIEKNVCRKNWKHCKYDDVVLIISWSRPDWHHCRGARLPPRAIKLLVWVLRPMLSPRHNLKTFPASIQQTPAAISLLQTRSPTVMPIWPRSWYYQNHIIIFAMLSIFSTDVLLYDWQAILLTCTTLLIFSSFPRCKSSWHDIHTSQF